jgi:tetratricopeptide (TPR) repeat protein
MQAHPKLRVELLLDLSAVHYRLGDLGRFEALARAAEPLARELGQPGPLSGALGAIGVSLQNRGELDAALLLQQEAVALARRSGDRKQLATMLHNTAMVHKSRGTLPECHGLLEEALAVMREIGHDDGTAVMLNALGDTLHLSGKLDEARSTFEAGLQLTEERGLPMRQQIFRLSLGHVLIDLAQHDDARALLERARADGQRNGHFHVEVYSLLRLARLDLVEGHADASLQRCREVFRRARAGGFEGIALEALVQHTDWLDRHGDPAYARQLRTWLLQASALPSLLQQRLRDLLAANPGGTDAAVPPGFDLRAAAARLAALPPVQA